MCVYLNILLTSGFISKLYKVVLVHFSFVWNISIEYIQKIIENQENVSETEI